MNFLTVSPVVAIVLTRDSFAAVVMLRDKVLEQRTLDESTFDANMGAVREVFESLKNHTSKAIAFAERTFRQRLSAPQVRIAFGSGYGILKQIENLPKVKSRNVRLGLIRESADRMFVRPDADYLVAETVDDQNWIAAYGRNSVDALSAAAVLEGASIKYITTTTSLHLCARGTLERPSKLEMKNSALDLAHRMARSNRIPLAAWKSQSSSRSQFVEVHGKTLISTAAIAVITATGLFGPMLVESIRVRETARMFVEAEAVRAQYEQNAKRLDVVSETLNQINEFQRHRRSVMQTLAVLSSTLPENVIIEQLRVDSVGGTLTVAGPDAGHAATLLEHNPTFANIEFVSPIQWIGGTGNAASARTADTTNTAQNSRVTIRYRHGVFGSRAAPFGGGQ